MLNETKTPATCIIVDDEPMAREVIRRYIQKLPTLQLLAEFGNAIDASIYLQEHETDIIFLDIRMPQMLGTEFVKSLRHIPNIIFTTAHKEYAYDGYELDVTDYLLKPIRFDRFLRAVNKAMPAKIQMTEVAVNTQEPVTASSGFIYLRVDRKMVKVVLDDITYIESDKDYVKIYTDKNYLITRQTIASVEAMLPESQFARIHRSFIISLAKVKSYTYELVEIGNKELPIGKLYRQHFMRLHGSLHP